MVYQEFADQPERFVIKDAPEYINHAVIGVDFGGGTSAHAFCCLGFYGNRIVVLDEYREKEALNPTKLENDFIDFVRRCKTRWLVTDVWCDSAEQTLINGLRTAAAASRLPVNIGNALKKPINDRIRALCMLMGSNRFAVCEACKWTIDALKTAVWDNRKPTEDVRLDNGSTNIDSLDALEYAYERDIPTLVEGWR